MFACTFPCTVPLQDLYRISRHLAAVVVPHQHGGVMFMFEYH